MGEQTEFVVRKMGHPVTVELDADGTPFCFCIMHRGERVRMVRAEPDGWSCPDWPAMERFLEEGSRRIDAALGLEAE
jgi:hypothetical protein